MNISIMINQLFDKKFKVPVESQIERAFRAGFKHQDISFWDWAFYSQSPFRADNWEDWVHGINEYRNRLGIVFNQAHAPVCLIPEEQHLLEEMHIRTIKSASILGIKWVVFHPYDYPGTYDKAHCKEMKEKNIREYSKLLDISEKYKVGIAMENMHAKRAKSENLLTGRYCTVTEDLMELVDSFNSEYMGVCWDTGHGNLVAQNQCQSIKSLGKRIKALHVHDNYGMEDQHLVPFHGNIEWSSVMKAFRDIGYEGDFNFEASLHLDKLPESCKDISLHLLYTIGVNLVNMR